MTGSKKTLAWLSMAAIFCLALPQGSLGGDITSITSDCGSTGGHIEQITMEGCDGEVDDRCEVKNGQQVKGQLKFAANKKTKSLTCKLFASISGIEVEFPGGCPVPDACSSLVSGNCPIDDHETFVYNIDIEIASPFTTDLDGKWTLIGDDKTDFVCFKIPISIV